MTLAIIIIVLYWEDRNFYDLQDGKSVTVWKTFNNVSYVIPGRFYGVLPPANNFIESTNTNDLTVYFTSNLPKGFIFKSEHPVKVNNDNKNEFVFYDYNQNIKRFDDLLYIPQAKKNNDLKDSAELIDIFIEDNFALDKNGKKL